jgi:hypothetical protein
MSEVGRKRTTGILDAVPLPRSVEAALGGYPRADEHDDAAYVVASHGHPPGANRRPMNEKQLDLLRLTEVSANDDSMT